MLTSMNPSGPVEVFPGIILVPTGGMVHFVHNSGAAALDLLPAGMAAPQPGGFYTTVNAALAACRANRGDRIICLPGHAENIAVADAWSNVKAGVTVLGTGVGVNAATFTWTAAAATLLLTKDNFIIQNCNLLMAGPTGSTTAITVAKAIHITGIACQILDCDIQVGVDADQIITLGILVAAAKAKLMRNRIIGDTTAAITAAGTVIRLTAANEVQIRDNFISASLATATDGPIESLTTASLNIDIRDNFIYSNNANSTCCLDFGAAIACTGWIDWNQLVVDADGTAQTVALTVNAANNLALGQNNFMVSNNNERGLIVGTATT